MASFQGIGENISCLNHQCLNGFGSDTVSCTNFSCWESLPLGTEETALVESNLSVVRLFFLLVLTPWSIATIGLVVALVTQILPRTLCKLKDVVLRITCGIQKPTSNRLEKGVWTIHGRRYDLDAFKHPGGQWSLELGRNRDATGLFESYHSFVDKNRLMKIMAKYELPESKQAHEGEGSKEKEATNPTGLIFDDPFHRDCKEMALKYFEELGPSSHKMKWEVFVASLVVIAVHIYLGILACSGSRWALVTMPILGWWLTANVSHEASHFAVAKRPWLNRIMACSSSPMFYNSAAWHVQHVLQHHIYTNDEMDVDLYHFQPLMRITRLSGFTKVNNFQWLWVWLVLPTAAAHLLFIVPMDLLTGQLDAITGKKRYHQAENLEDFVAAEHLWIAVELVACWIFLLWNLYLHGVSNGFSLEGVGCVALAYTMSSMLLIIFTQGAHIQEECQEPKLSEALLDKSWAKRQALTAVAFQPKSKFWTNASGGLNMQALHHIMPGISASHLYDLYPRFLEVCKKHSVEVKEVNGLGAFFGGFLTWVHELAQDLDAACEEKSKSM
jgi:fatty acid desaturase